MVISRSSTGPACTFRGRLSQAAQGVPQIEPRPTHQVGWIDLKRDELLQAAQRIAKDVPHPINRAEKVSNHGKRTADNLVEEQSRSARPIHPALNLGDFEIGIDRRVHADELPDRLQIVDTLAKRAIHNESPLSLRDRVRVRAELQQNVTSRRLVQKTLAPSRSQRKRRSCKSPVITQVTYPRLITCSYN